MKPRHFHVLLLEPFKLTVFIDMSEVMEFGVAGIPLTVHSVRPGSRASSERSVGSTGYSQRGSRGVIVPASRAGAARAAAILLISCHLTPDQTQQGNLLPRFSGWLHHTNVISIKKTKL